MRCLTWNLGKGIITVLENYYKSLIFTINFRMRHFLVIFKNCERDRLSYHNIFGAKMQSCINAKANDMITLEIRLQNHSKIHRLAHVKKFAIMHHSLMIFLAFHDAVILWGKIASISFDLNRATEMWQKTQKKKMTTIVANNEKISDWCILAKENKK